MTLENYDPNEAERLDTVHVIELVFQYDAYTATETAEVGGNCLGFENIETAIDVVYGRLPEREYSGHPYAICHIVLTDKDGNTLEVEDDYAVGEPFLKELLVSARIVDVKREEQDAQ